jgi:hypothetical protein
MGARNGWFHARTRETSQRKTGSAKANATKQVLPTTFFPALTFHFSTLMVCSEY